MTRQHKRGPAWIAPDHVESIVVSKKTIGTVDFLAAVERLQAVVAVLASFLVGPLRANCQVRGVGWKPSSNIDSHDQPRHRHIS